MMVIIRVRGGGGFTGLFCIIDDVKIRKDGD